MKSPFVDGKGDVAPSHVLVAAKILSATTLAQMMPNEPSKQDLDEARKMITDNEYFLSQVSQVYETIADQSYWPVFWKKDGNPSGRGVPWVLSVICSLIKGGVPLEDAWTMPESQAIWMQAAISISNGVDIDIVSPEDLAAQKKLDELYARLEAGSSVE